MTRETIVFGDPQTEKVDFFAAAQEFEVEMRTGRMSGLCHITNYISCIHCPSVAHARGKARKMSIARHVPAGMYDVHDVTVALTPADKVHASSAYRDYRSPRRSGGVDGHVRLHSAGDWILPAQTIRRRDSDITQRRAQKRSTSRSPFAV